MENAILVVITALCSGLIATIITLWWQNKNQIKIEKLRIFRVLMAKRYDLISEENVDALNVIDAVFYSSQNVRAAWKEFIDATNLPESPTRPQIINDKHLRLLEVVAEDIGFKKIKWEDIKHYYYPIGLSQKKQDESVLRKVQIDAGLAQINKVKEQTDTSQTDKKSELTLQLLTAAMSNPDGLLKLMEAAEKAQNINQKK